MKTKLATSEKTRCYGFDKTDHRRCRLECRPGQKTCHIHRNYYKNWEFYLGPWQNTSKPSPRKLDEMRFQYTYGGVVPDENYLREFLNSIYWHEYTDYYLFMVQHANLNPMLCYTDMTVILQTSMQHDLTVQSETQYKTPALVSAFLKYVGMAPYVRNFFTAKIVQYLMDTQGLDTAFIDYMNLISVIYYTCPEWRELVLEAKFETNVRDCIGASKKVHPHLNWNDIERRYNQYAHPILHAVKVYHRNILKDRMADLKPEIVAAAWHPRRVEKWIEAGLDLDDL